MAALAALAQQEWATPVTYTAITPAELVADLAADGEDPWWIYAYSSMFASIREHRWATVSADAERLTGHPPTPVRTILARYQPASPSAPKLDAFSGEARLPGRASLDKIPGRRRLGRGRD